MKLSHNCCSHVHVYRKLQDQFGWGKSTLWQKTKIKFSTKLKLSRVLATVTVTPIIGQISLSYIIYLTTIFTVEGDVVMSWLLLLGNIGRIDNKVCTLGSRNIVDCNVELHTVTWMYILVHDLTTNCTCIFLLPLPLTACACIVINCTAHAHGKQPWLHVLVPYVLNM